MASGKTHEKINLIAFIPLLYLLGKIDYFFFSCGYLFSTFLLSPDNDLYTSRSVKRWGPLKFIWWPYSKVFKHRKLSHFPFLGSLSRIIYLTLILIIFVLIWIIFYLFFISKSGKTTLPNISLLWITYLDKPQFWAFLIGTTTSEAIHLLTDLIFSFWKKR